MISLGILLHSIGAILAMDSIFKCVEWMFDLARQLPYLSIHKQKAEFFEKPKNSNNGTFFLWLINKLSFTSKAQKLV